MPRTRYVAFALAILAFCFCVIGWVYWGQDRNGDAYRCVYGDPICSLTIATWILVVATISAFLAAFKGAKEAVRAFKIGFDNLKTAQSTLVTAQKALVLEQASLLGQRKCGRASHDVPEMNWWIDSDLRFYENKPFDDAWGEPVRHDFFNLGRSALVQPSVDVFVETADSEIPKQWTMYFPGIPTDQGVHVSFHFLQSLQVNLRFSETEPSNRRPTLAEELAKRDHDDPGRMRFFGEPQSNVPTIVLSGSIKPGSAQRKPELPQTKMPEAPPDVP